MGVKTNNQNKVLVPTVKLAAFERATISKGRPRTADPDFLS